MSATIAVFLDGTWDDPKARTSITDLYQRARRRHGDTVARYVEGVGVHFPRFGGGAFGWGLNEQIVRGYAEVVDAWFGAGEPAEDEAEIFLFGFSRGAFSARSLAGMIVKCGLLPPDTMRPDAVFDRYRDPGRPGWREMADGEKPIRDDEDRTVSGLARKVRIRFVGVLDTVGALGVPGRWGTSASPRYAFHDTSLSGLVDVARHALALDELRATFPATLWTSVPIPVPGVEPDVEQRWFAGAHGDIGGGGPSLVPALAREWMAREATAAGLDLAPVEVGDGATVAPLGRPEQSFPFALIARLPELGDTPRRIRSTALNETLDPSVRRRWEQVAEYRAQGRVRPAGLWPWITERQGAPTP